MNKMLKKLATLAMFFLTGFNTIISSEAQPIKCKEKKTWFTSEQSKKILEFVGWVAVYSLISLLLSNDSEKTRYQTYQPLPYTPRVYLPPIFIPQPPPMPPIFIPR